MIVDIVEFFKLHRPSHANTDAKDLWIRMIKDFAEKSKLNKNTFYETVGAPELVVTKKCQVYWSGTHEEPKRAKYIFISTQNNPIHLLICEDCFNHYQEQVAKDSSISESWTVAKII